MSLTGRSPLSVDVGKAELPASTLRFVNTPDPGAAPPSSTLNTCPGAAGAIRTVEGAGQVARLVPARRRRRGSDAVAVRATQRLVVAAPRVATVGGELRTVRLVEGDVGSRLLRNRGMPGAEGPRPPD